MLKIALAQINSTVGDLAGNAHKIIDYAAQAQKLKADVVVFPELAVCGYPPEDLLLKGHFVANNIKTLNALAKKMRGITAIVGFVDNDASGHIYNAAAFISDGSIKAVYHKQQLPNYGVFDEKRYFSVGQNRGLIEIKGIKVGLNICEDIWVDGGIYRQQSLAQAQVIINISSSPYEEGKLAVRQDLLARRAKEIKAPMVYVNMVAGQDELVFDGGSMVMAANGTLLAQAKQFEEQLLVVDFAAKPTALPPKLEAIEEVYQALVLGTRDYVVKNGFKKVTLGLSGGIDSALVAAIAVDALGRENVIGISMPSQFNSKATQSDAKTLAKNLGIEFKELPIKKIFAVYLKELRDDFEGTAPNIAEENLQARIRGNMLMAFSNKFGWLVLTTGNKSEMAVGYCTLYGDMNGGFAPLKDIFKTKVYALCRWRNSITPKAFIPKSIILRAPSAELRPDQTDEASLGAYEDLDYVLQAYVEKHQSAETIATASIDAKYIAKIMRLVDLSEYKRRQAPPGVKITARAFGKDWRLPITNKYRE